MGTAEDLVDRVFRRRRPNQLWVTDITEHPTREGKVYCAVVLDTFSRRVVGWSISHNPSAGLTTNALGMAIEQREATRGTTIIHSDHGTQGEFNRSSQRSSERSCDEREESEVGWGWSAGDAVAGASAGRPSGAPLAVLGGDRSRSFQRGRGH